MTAESRLLDSVLPVGTWLRGEGAWLCSMCGDAATLACRDGREVGSDTNGEAAGVGSKSRSISSDMERDEEGSIGDKR